MPSRQRCADRPVVSVRQMPLPPPGGGVLRNRRRRCSIPFDQSLAQMTVGIRPAPAPAPSAGSEPEPSLRSIASELACDRVLVTRRASMRLAVLPQRDAASAAGRVALHQIGRPVSPGGAHGCRRRRPEDRANGGHRVGTGRCRHDRRSRHVWLTGERWAGDRALSGRDQESTPGTGVLIRRTRPHRLLGRAAARVVDGDCDVGHGGVSSAVGSAMWCVVRSVLWSVRPGPDGLANPCRSGADAADLDRVERDACRLHGVAETVDADRAASGSNDGR